MSDLFKAFILVALAGIGIIAAPVAATVVGMLVGIIITVYFIKGVLELERSDRKTNGSGSDH